MNEDIDRLDMFCLLQYKIMYNIICMFMKLRICCVNEDMDRNGYKSSLFILVLKGINKNERFSYT